jgi:hypothetical protein
MKSEISGPLKQLSEVFKPDERPEFLPPGMRTPLTLDVPAPLRYLDEFLVSNKIVRPLDEALGTPELRYARTREGERVLSMRWTHGGAAHEDLKVFWLEELRSLHQLADADDEEFFARILAARADAEGFHLVLARDGRRLLAKLLEHDPWLCESPSDRAHTWRNLARLAGALGVLHERGIAHRNLSSWSVLASNDRTDHFQLIGFEWPARRSRAFFALERDVIRASFLSDWRGLAALAKPLLGVGASAVECTESELKFVHDLEHSVHLDGARARRRALNIAAELESESGGGSAVSRRWRRTDAQMLALQGLLLAQVIQMLLRTASEFPVEVVDATRIGQRSGRSRWRIRLRVRQHPQHAALCRALNIRSPLQRRLYEALTQPRSGLSDRWYWARKENDEGEEAELSFVRVHDAAERHFIFDSDIELRKLTGGTLINTQGGRADQQFHRQLRAWRALRRRPALLDELRDPSPPAAVAANAPLEDARFAELDPDKQRAVRKALAAGQLALTHGPPGVGKTTLVAELVRQIDRAAPGSKLLFSAQSHAAVDHLLSAVRETASASAFLVRCYAPEAKRASAPEDLPRQVGNILNALRDSSGLANASDSLREIVRSLIEGNTRHTEASATRLHRRPLEAHLLRAATLVFGTSNCASFERLLNEQMQFDLSIIEEAAKATGNDLLNSLFLARRQLLIGDHHQLPPFDSEKIEKLLASPARVAQLLASLPESVELLFEREVELHEMQRLFARHRANSRQLSELCQSALRTLFLFKTLATAPHAATESGYASALTLQHRMHPAIARVVSHAFYGDTLGSDPTCIARFARAMPPVRFGGSHYPDLPIVWIDTPWVQHEGHGEQQPGPVNLGEVHAVTQVVQALERDPHADKPPSLAVLTPYRKQLARLESALWSSTTSALQRFRSIGGSYFHTVDSFQGNEADVVIVSLVRNNGSHTLNRALGFLQDERRMTVLMSRAKWRLIVVGSLDFLRATMERHSATSENSVQFLKRLLEGIDEARAQSTASIVRPHRPRLRRGRR